ncbi:4-hydroxyphenylpyruvate dioxygenase [Nocardiopsis eucommiae]|uniref:4-hydroxyphenylpyruvate dioxygenase n=1 Tax=Nocardiopsis eucommiae TaxID=2831970 RepID=A0A975QKE4_9ACTN|nr:4-hydroxyphenylpyruvate dioxygenase [Nocardiopsis eucommiae]
MTALHGLTVDHVRIHTADAEKAALRMRDGYGMDTLAESVQNGTERSTMVGAGGIRMVFTQALTGDHPVADYVRAHGDGVADIALTAGDARAAHDLAVSRGAESVAAPTERDGVVTATVGGFGDVTHTFVERAPGTDARRLPGLSPVAGGGAADLGLLTVDHLAVCLAPGGLDPTVEYYRTVLGFELIFEERVVVGSQAMVSRIVRSAGGDVTLTLIEPDQDLDPGHIDDFVRDHGGPGVQHIALSTADAVSTVGALRRRGVAFLATPDAYYRLLGERLDLRRHSVEELRELDILVDEDHDGQLFQIFARSTHPRNTVFFEVIERLGATTFGSGNIRALYEAVEQGRED